MGTTDRSALLEALGKYEGTTADHPIPELPGDVVFKLRALTKRDQMEIRKDSLGPDGLQLQDVDAFEAGLFLAGVAEPKLEDEDLELMFSIDAGIFDRVVQHIMQLSGLDVKQESVERRFPGATQGAT